MSDNINILIRAILAKTSKEQLERELRNINKNLKPLEIKANVDKVTKDFKVLTDGTKELSKVTTEITNQIGQQVKTIALVKKGTKELIINSETVIDNYKKQRAEIEKINAEQSKYWSQRRKEAVEAITQNNTVLQQMRQYYTQLEKTSRRDFNYGQLISGVDASTFDSSDNFLKYIKQQYGDTAELIGSFNDKQLKTGDIITQANFRVKEGADKWRMYQATLNKTTGEMRLLDKGLRDVVNRQLSFNEATRIAISRIIQWGIATSLVYGSFRRFREAIDYIHQFDDAVVELTKVVDLSQQQIIEMKNAAIEMGKALGKSSVDIMKGMAEFGRITKDTEEIKALTETAILASNVTSLSVADAAKAIESAMIQFNISGEESIKIIDQWNELQNNFAVSAEDLAAGLSKVGSIAAQTNMPMEKLNAMITTLVSSMRITGDEAGTALKSIISRVYRIGEEGAEDAGRTEEMLNRLGIVIRKSKDEFLPFDQILAKIAERFKTMTQAEKLALEQQMGGTYHYAKVASLLENQEITLKAITTAYNSQNSAMIENQKYLDSITGRLETLGTTWEDFTNSVLSSDVFKFIISGLTNIVDGLNTVPGKISLVIASITLLTMAVITFKTQITAATLAVKGFFTSLGPIGWITLAVTTLTPLVLGLANSFNEASEAQKKLNQQNQIISGLAKQYFDLKNKLKELKEGTDEYNLTQEQLKAIKEQIRDLNPELITSYDNEGNAVGVLESALAKLAQQYNNVSNAQNNMTKNMAEEAIKRIRIAEAEVTEQLNLYSKLPGSTRTGQEPEIYRDINGQPIKLMTETELMKQSGTVSEYVFGLTATKAKKQAAENLSTLNKMKRNAISIIKDIADSNNEDKGVSKSSSSSSSDKDTSQNSKTPYSSKLDKYINQLQIIEQKENEITELQKQRDLLEENKRIPLLEKEIKLQNELYKLYNDLAYTQAKDRENLAKQLNSKVVTVSKDYETLTINKEAYNKLSDKEKEKLDELIVKYNELTRSYHANLQKKLEIQKATQDLSQQIDDYIEKVFDSYQNYLIKSIEDEIEALEESKNKAKEVAQSKIDAIQKEIDKLEKRNDELKEEEERQQRLLDIQKQKELIANIEKERNVRIFQNGEWQWVADPRKLREEQEKLKDMQEDYDRWEAENRRQARINKLREQIKQIQDELAEDERRYDRKIKRLNDFLKEEKARIENQNTWQITSLIQLMDNLKGIEESKYSERLEALVEFINEYNRLSKQLGSSSTVDTSYNNSGSSSGNKSSGSSSSNKSSSSGNSSNKSSGWSTYYDSKHTYQVDNKGNIYKDGKYVDTNKKEVRDALNNSPGGKKALEEAAKKHKGYADGGINTTPGLYPLHGTPTASEVIFNATQAKNLFDFVKFTLPKINLPSFKLDNNNNNIKPSTIYSIHIDKVETQDAESFIDLIPTLAIQYK